MSDNVCYLLLYCVFVVIYKKKADDAIAKHVSQVQEDKWNNITKSCVYLQFKMFHQEASVVETIKLKNVPLLDNG